VILIPRATFIVMALKEISKRIINMI